MVTASSDRAAQNYGHDAQPDHDVRYEMAEEFTELVGTVGLVGAGLDGRRPGAGVFADPTKVHPVDFEGRFYKTRGPINTGPRPQGRPVIVQAGGSDDGPAYASQLRRLDHRQRHSVAG